ncbi:hypothetical protein [Mongoliitalea lutea]|uniref:Tetratricopeptide repeat-containing protein n=1 Tax=Mongoliitalea lutea TaxID=849756 RepID=A0A8J3G3X0_9BACT|nr:hypothetical protein [Mongoliitalea lutea]GHB26269.1 hypothetical protein GCM10008106_03570 [Mongoliitalea lutea]
MEKDKSDLLDLYIGNKLLEQDREAFENELKSNPELQEELNFRKNLLIAATLQERKRLKAILQEKAFENHAKEKNQWKLAASVAGILISLSIIFFIFNKKSDREALFLAYYETFPNIEAPTVRGDADFNGLSEAFLAYDNEEFELAKLLFYDHYQLHGDEVSAFYAAMSALEIGEFEESYDLLVTIQNSCQESYQVPVMWYISLIQIKQNNTDEAVKHLKELAQIDHPLSSKAEEIIQKLR